MKQISITYKAKLFAVGVETKDRRLIGSDAIDWIINAKLVRDTEDKRQNAIDLGNSFMTQGFIKHVCDNHKFENEKL